MNATDSHLHENKSASTSENSISTIIRGIAKITNHSSIPDNHK